MPCTAVLSLALDIMISRLKPPRTEIQQKLDQILLSFSQAAKLMLTCLLETYRGHNQAKASAKSAEKTNLYIQLAQLWNPPDF
jgi:hypothetical protein